MRRTEVANAARLGDKTRGRAFGATPQLLHGAST